MSADFVANPAGIAEVLRGPGGPVFRHLIVLGTKVQARAKELVGVRSGNLRSTIVKRIRVSGTGLAVEVGSDLPYAYFHHEGTKAHVIHGGKGGRDGKLWFIGNEGHLIGVYSVNHPGTKANPFLTQAVAEIVPTS